MILHISGRVRELETGRPVPGVTVEAYDADALSDDLLGRATTDDEGRYDVQTKSRRGLLRERPDAYVLLKDGEGHTLKSTRSAHLKDIDEDVVIDVPISCFKLVQVGMLRREQLPAELVMPGTSPILKQWLFQAENGDPTFIDIEKDVASKASLLDLFADYGNQLRAEGDHARVFAKLDKLFTLGSVPRSLLGHCYGVALGLRPSDKHSGGPLGGVVEILWGAKPEYESTWIGTSFEKIDPSRFTGLTGELLDPSKGAALGKNHFKDRRPSASYQALSLWLHLHQPPVEERTDFGHDRSGASCLAMQAASLHADSGREVLAMNYRLPGLRNRPPVSWMVGELVEVGDGLYLGQLLLARKRRIWFDVRHSAEDHAYEHLGYFLLWNVRWNHEARRLFPALEIPMSIPTLVDEDDDTPTTPEPSYHSLR